MSIEIEYDDDGEKWNDYVERSPQGNPFHLRESVEAMAAHTNTDLHPLVGFKGQEPVGLFPLFEARRAGVSTLFSPPADLHVPYLGPALLNMEKLKQRKAERRHERFVDGCLEWVEEHVDPKYVQLRTDGRYRDLRPIMWNGFDVEPGYTYVVDLSVGEEALMSEFSSDARSNIRGADDADYTVEEGGLSAIRRIVGQVRDRYQAQDEFYGLTPAFVADLYRRTPEGTVRPYTCTADGEFLGGMVALELGDTIYRWQGGAKHDADLPVNDLVDWAIMRDAIDRGVDDYDLVGADTPRLNGYKAKFGPDIREFHNATRSNPVMDLAAELYRRLR